jgi:hypothetical protein
MKRIITHPQKSDMGSGFGYIDAVGCTLEELLDFYAKNKTWGTVCIHKNGEILRKFDYDTFNNNIFYHNLNGWEYRMTVKKAEFEYYFMNEDLDIYLN